MDDQTKLVAAITIILIIIVAIVIKDVTTMLTVIVGLVGVFVLVTRYAKKTDEQELPKGSNRLAQSGFDPELVGETAAPRRGFCPRSTPREIAGARIENGALDVLNGETFRGRKEGFTSRPTRETYTTSNPLPGPHPPMSIPMDPPYENVTKSGAYKGAIEFEDYDVDSAGGPLMTSAPDGGNYDNAFPSSFDMTADSSWDSGHKDRLEGVYEQNPVEGNPFDLSRTAAPESAEPCISDEANNDSFDADELNTYQARSRNDATRVEAGIMNRRRDMDKYFREGLEIDENKYWWGRHEI